MKQAAVAFLALVGAVALVVGGVLLWRNRPDRPAVVVNGRVLTDRELTWRAQTLIDDAKRMENLLIPARRMKEAMRHYRRMAAKMWIVKEVLLAAAVESGTKVDAKDEKASLAKLEAQLKPRKITSEQFFKEGPIPEEMKRAEFKETVLIEKFADREIGGKIKFGAKDIDDKAKEIRELNELAIKAGRKPAFKTDRKSVIDAIHRERYNMAFRDLFRDRFSRMSVECPAYPDLEAVDGVSPPRRETGR